MFKQILHSSRALAKGGFSFSQTSPGFYVSAVPVFLKTLQEKEKLLVTSNSFFSHSVFYLFGELSAIFNKFEIVVCKLFQFGTVKNLSFGNGFMHPCNVYYTQQVFTDKMEPENPFKVQIAANYKGVCLRNTSKSH